MIRHRVASFWRRPSRSLKEEFARGVVCCPACDHEARVVVFKAMSKRRPTSPDLVAYAVPGPEETAPTHNAIKAPFTPGQDGGTA